MKKIIKLVIFLIIVLIIGRVLNSVIHKEKDNINEAPMKGMGLFIENKKNNIHNSSIQYNDINDYSYKFTNATGKSLDCKLNIFIDGKQITMLDKSKSSVIDSYDFIISNNESIILPINLLIDNISKGIHSITFNVISDYNNYAIDKKNETWVDSCYNYNAVLINESEEIFLKNTSSEYMGTISDTVEQEYNQLLPNFTINQLEENRSPENYIKATPSSSLKIPLIIGGGDNSQNILYCVLDNKQIKLSDKKILIYNHEINKSVVTEVTINTPSEVGKYDMIFYSLDDFDKISSNESYDFRIRSSYRITLLIQ